MSVDSLKQRKDVLWVDSHSLKPGEFGPPVYEEKKTYYMWRLFKRGFNWGKYMILPCFRVLVDCNSHGSVLSDVLLAQTRS